MLGRTDKIIAEKIIIALEIFEANQQNKFKGSEIYEKIIDDDSSFRFKVTENRFKSCISKIANSNTRIRKDMGSHGYYLIPSDQVLEVKQAETDKDFRWEKNIPRERLIYPILEKYLKSKGYRTKDTSLMTRNGKWGHPDITGIIATNTLGTTEFEIVSIEAKVSVSTFRQDFWQAVAHRFFANRSYFAFVASSDYLQTHNEELRHYSELYKVGIIVVVLEEDHLQDFKQGLLKKINEDMVNVIEVSMAPYESHLLKWQKPFLTCLGVHEPNHLYEWGDAN